MQQLLLKMAMLPVQLFFLVTIVIHLHLWTMVNGDTSAPCTAPAPPTDNGDESTPSIDPPPAPSTALKKPFWMSSVSLA
jgi:hypothetical protein